MNKQTEKIITICGLLCFPAVHFYLLEAYTHNGFTTVRPWSQLCNILLFELAAVILALLFRSAKWALRAQGLCVMVIGLVNYYVYTFRSLPLVPWDIFSIGTAASVADNYNFVPEGRVVAVVLAFAAVLWLEGFCKWDFKRLKWQFGVLGALLLTVGLTSFAGILQNEDFQNRHRMYNKLFTPVYMWQSNGFVLTMVMEMPFMAIEKPAGYDRQKARQILEENEPIENESKENQTMGKKPNIIVVMDEAFSDLGVLGEFEPSEDYMPYFHSIFYGEKNTVTGYLHVSVCGGNTANTEFEFLTGNTMAFLPQGSIPYQQYIHSEIPALPAYLQSLGYETYAMHPYYASGWDRDSVYPLLGFSHMVFLDGFRNRTYVRQYVSDQSCVDKIKDAYEKKEAGKPLFLFQVTMQNHGSYADVYDNFTPHITVKGAESYSLSSYLSLLQKTDDSLMDLISYFSKEKEPAVIVFFGDHQPNDVVAEPILRLNGKSCRTLSEEDTYLRYQVPYLIWTNYDMETENNLDMSANYLAGKVLEAAGLPLPAYWNYLKKFQESYPVFSAARTEKKGSAADLEEYKKLQDYQLFDIEN